ncbi:PepSY-associated TM helix domain-containing protein [Mangrovivirga sp. M17]|uniref:PepSY-associated TM helix domain-containing protein n=1 Tax=Mangrovivirga halotolerans TaxID=2993936 RepID=A0ABT3RU44_9BACT|nr:PepSY-associated TM helix domain-containing protein [Mangrovivirga halotolerans]MCX2745128.1 PepSY-associated TM helix domain-containing protein [Mangrovivirga halotolerans]
MSFKKVVRKIHLWLGFITGPIVFIVALTGCLYAFQEEIQDLTQPYRFIENSDQNKLEPSKLQEIVKEKYPEKSLHALMYYNQNRSAKAIFYSNENEYYFFVYLNPYTGEIIHVKDELSSFFRIVLDGHFYLWLPHEIGQPLVASATLIFLLIVVSGLILWWPKNKKASSQRFKIKFKGKWKRTNFDLHTVLGFYVSVFATLFAITGLIWGFQWFRDMVYTGISGGDKFENYSQPLSGTNHETDNNKPSIDTVWEIMKKEYPRAEWIEIHPPHDSLTTIAANANPDASTYWKMDYRYFDQYSLEEKEVDHIWNRYNKSSTADLIMRLNYDVHVGAIGGIPGKFLAFIFSLIIASMPVTGLLIWYGRKTKSPKRKIKVQAA